MIQLPEVNGFLQRNMVLPCIKIWLHHFTITIALYLVTVFLLGLSLVSKRFWYYSKGLFDCKTWMEMETGTFSVWKPAQTKELLSGDMIWWKSSKAVLFCKTSILITRRGQKTYFLMGKFHSLRQKFPFPGLNPVSIISFQELKSSKKIKRVKDLTWSLDADAYRISPQYKLWLIIWSLSS